MNSSLLLLLIPVIISATVVLALINEESPLFNNTTNAKANVYHCDPKSLDEVKLSFPVKEPTYMPEGYKLEVVDPYSLTGVERSEDSNLVLLFYSKQPLCTSVYSGYGDVIRIEVSNVQPVNKSDVTYGIDLEKDPLAYFNKVAESYNSYIPNAAELIDKPESSIPVVRIVNINDYLGIAREPSKGYSVYKFYNEDGSIKDKVVEELDDINPGFVTFYHAKDKTMYTIEAKLPVEEILKIAESIP